ncbi:unnamed protein product [Toxocara canis]|uniref:Salivary secreted protein of 21.3 kDa n=1 Tax=Toxocara canis TaxID=6265 RepID=A0A183U3B2_TOXCA|nr:unnamed protein product [Toxocara canis]
MFNVHIKESRLSHTTTPSTIHFTMSFSSISATLLLALAISPVNSQYYALSPYRYAYPYYGGLYSGIYGAYSPLYSYLRYGSLGYGGLGTYLYGGYPGLYLGLYPYPRLYGYGIYPTAASASAAEDVSADSADTAAAPEEVTTGAAEDMSADSADTTTAPDVVTTGAAEDMSADSADTTTAPDVVTTGAVEAVRHLLHLEHYLSYR